MFLLSEQNLNMRYTSVTEQGQIVFHYSVSKEVEQFLYLTALMEAKEVKAYSKSKSTLDFKSLQFNNTESLELDGHQEEELFRRRYTLPRGFKYNKRPRVIEKISSPKEDAKEVEEEEEDEDKEEKDALKGLNVSKSLSNFYLHNMFSEKTSESDCAKCTSFQNLGLKQLFYQPRLQPSVSYFNLTSLFKGETTLAESMSDLNIKSLFKEVKTEADPFDEELNLDTLFQENSGTQSKMTRRGKALKNLKKAFSRPFKAVRRAVSRFC